MLIIVVLNGNAIECIAFCCKLLHMNGSIYIFCYNFFYIIWNLRKHGWVSTVLACFSVNAHSDFELALLVRLLWKFWFFDCLFGYRMLLSRRQEVRLAWVLLAALNIPAIHSALRNLASSYPRFVSFYSSTSWNVKLNDIVTVGVTWLYCDWTMFKIHCIDNKACPVE